MREEPKFEISPDFDPTRVFKMWVLELPKSWLKDGQWDFSDVPDGSLWVVRRSGYDIKIEPAP